VSHRIRFSKRQVAKLSRRPQKKYDLVCANLISNLLMEQIKRIVGQLRPDGGLVIAGILKEEFARIQTAYEHAGLRLILGKTEKEWRSGFFEWRDKS
jgi:ribosomal protein L11 methyltransferase